MSSLRKSKIAVLCGGDSPERLISLKSGKAVQKALVKSGFHAVNLDVGSKVFEEALKDRAFDIAFLALHGVGGEDGSIQRRLERLRIPYTGSSAASSRLAFNKYRSKQHLLKNYIATPASRLIKKIGDAEKLKKFTLPVYLKPVENGSSIDVYRVSTRKSLESRLKRLLEKYSAVLVEEGIEGREFTVAIVGGKALNVIEIIPKRKFYDYKAKYEKTGTRFDVPAKMDTKASQRMKSIALKTHRLFGMRDFSRVDFICDQELNPYVLEVNSIPGMTQMSLLPKAAKDAGMSFERLCESILKSGWKRRV